MSKLKMHEQVAAAIAKTEERRRQFPKPSDQALILLDALEGLGYRVTRIPASQRRKVQAPAVACAHCESATTTPIYFESTYLPGRTPSGYLCKSCHENAVDTDNERSQNPGEVSKMEVALAYQAIAHDLGSAAPEDAAEAVLNHLRLEERTRNIPASLPMLKDVARVLSTECM